MRSLGRILCHSCRVRHVVVDRPGTRLADEFWHFQARHKGHALQLAPATKPLWQEVLDRLGWGRWGDLGAAYLSNADVKEAFGTSTAITCTLASLAQAGVREATAIDNTTNLFLEAFVYLAVKLQTGTPASDKTVYVYAYGSEDGTNYTDNATGADAAVTLRSPTNCRLIGVISTPDAGGLTYKSHPLSVTAGFGSRLPRKWGPVVENRTNITFSATEADHTKTYSGVYETVV